MSGGARRLSEVNTHMMNIIKIKKGYVFVSELLAQVTNKLHYLSGNNTLRDATRLSAMFIWVVRHLKVETLTVSSCWDVKIMDTSFVHYPENMTSISYPTTTLQIKSH